MNVVGAGTRCECQREAKAVANSWPGGFPGGFTQSREEQAMARGPNQPQSTWGRSGQGSPCPPKSPFIPIVGRWERGGWHWMVPITGTHPCSPLTGGASPQFNNPCQASATAKLEPQNHSFPSGESIVHLESSLFHCTVLHYLHEGGVQQMTGLCPLVVVGPDIERAVRISQCRMVQQFISSTQPVRLPRMLPCWDLLSWTFMTTFSWPQQHGGKSTCCVWLSINKNEA